MGYLIVPQKPASLISSSSTLANSQFALSFAFDSSLRSVKSSRKPAAQIFRITSLLKPDEPTTLCPIRSDVSIYTLFLWPPNSISGVMPAFIAQENANRTHEINCICRSCGNQVESALTTAYAVLLIDLSTVNSGRALQFIPRLRLFSPPRSSSRGTTRSRFIGSLQPHESLQPYTLWVKSKKRLTTDSLFGRDTGCNNWFDSRYRHPSPSSRMNGPRRERQTKLIR
ncbi:hypothetical protein BDM02DRAFT_59360 [Thelephora ganbajun]|uniref:Uncharacterized protein n=1 Tax=Thelephora ganbajun TaxID=370292 RepID=A0ACB6ZXR8_THEGA|nr:hypothetical protein BDM02DRAFT_59360 [Thelephora ganbajun]